MDKDKDKDKDEEKDKDKDRDVDNEGTRHPRKAGSQKEDRTSGRGTISAPPPARQASPFRIN